MLLEGKKISLQIQAELKAEIAAISGRKPGLAVILVGSHPASTTYVTMKRRACQEVGMESFLIHLPETISEQKLLKEIEKLNQDPHVDGILVQMPLPSHIKTEKIVEAIAPHKDVDCFHPYNVGKLTLGYLGGPLPCTPSGIYQLLKRSEVSVKGKHVVIVGRSNLVGKPLALLLSQKSIDATVTLAHSQSENLEKICSEADILVAAIGRPLFITPSFVKQKAIVIDVGINRVGDRLVGDVDFAHVAPKCRWITPVPGGIGPMTIAALLYNTLKVFYDSCSS